MQLPFEEFQKLRAKFPIIDVRSEGEYAQGHIPAAINIPILNNEERTAVGTVYKQKGQHDAILTGFRLVGPRLSTIISHAENVGRELLVHCWRGGMRSANFCQFLSMARIKTYQLQGGYKTYRTNALASFQKPLTLRVLGGCTGSGKSEIIRRLKEAGEQVLDLEQLASHKGSVFGGLLMSPQPTTEQFQNNLFEAISPLDLTKRIWIEDESISIGNIFLPEGLWHQMIKSPLMEVELDREIRIRRLVAEYGSADTVQFLEAMTRLTKRLGGQHFKVAKEKLLQGDMPAVIDILLTYYDKAYQNGLTRNHARLVGKVSWNGDQTDAIISKLKQWE